MAVPTFVSFSAVAGSCGGDVTVTLGSTSLLLKIHYVYGYTEPRMKLEHVQPVMDYLKQSAQVMKERADEITRWLDTAKAPKDKVEKKAQQDLALQAIECNAIRRSLEGQVHWLKHYARGGCLIAPDGTLTKEE